MGNRLRDTSLHAFLTGAAIAVFAFGVSAQRADVAGAPAGKLTTVLADLARAVPQTGSPSGTPSPGQTGAARLSLDGLPKSVQDAAREGGLRMNDRNEVQVYILVQDVTDEVVAELASAGAAVEIRDPARHRVQARIAASRLEAVAGLGVVHAIRLPTYARRRAGTAVSEGDALVRTDALRAQFSLDGTGVRVGVISDGLKGVFATGCSACPGLATGPLASGDLPSAVGARNASGVLIASTGGIVGKSFRANNDLEGLPPSSPVCSFAGAGAEGTALLEIVHDLAPGAKLSFANADTDLEFMQAVSFLAASNDVVLDDIGFYGEPYDGTSGVSRNTAAALNSSSNPIRAYFTAVGNDADEHYYGRYVDSGVDGTTISGLTSGGRLHLFQRTADTSDVLGLGSQPYNVISLPQNGEVAMFLSWDDPFGASANNYDLYLVQQSTGRVVARSTDVQNGRQDPVEAIDYVNGTGAADLFRIVVQNVGNAAQPRNLNLFSFQPECAAGGPQLLNPNRFERHNYNTPTRSVAAQGDAGGSPVSVISVGAVCSASAAAAGKLSSDSCLDPSNSTAELFSSQGPTLDGRTKPDIAAIDGVSISGAGGFPSPFFGTSAAAPHLGGMAALLLQAAPCLMNRSTSTIDAASARTSLRRMILSGATSLGGTSPNNTFGAGRADAVGAIQTALPSYAGPSSLVFPANSPLGASITATQLTFSDPNACGVTALNWSGSCGSGSTMTCPFGISSVSVAGSNNGLAFGPTSDLRITVTNFGLGVAPATATVTSGASARYVVTVSSQGGAFNTDVALSCGNIPTQATCTFDPPTVNPGSGSARSTLTISTAGSAATPPAFTWPRRLDLAGTTRIAPVAAVAFWLTLMGTAGLALARSRLRRAAIWAAACAGFAVLLSARGGLVAAPGFAVFPSTLTFGSQTVGTSSPPQLVYLTNIGADTLNLTGIIVTSHWTEVTSCGRQIPAGSSCVIAVTFAPTAAGSLSGSVSLVDDAAGSPQQVVGLVGTAVAVSSSTGPTPAGSYGMTIVGTAGTLIQAVPITLVVQ